MIRSRRSLTCAALVLIACSVPSAGCVNTLAGLAYIIKGTNVPAEYKDLKEKKVVVVCRTPASLTFGNANIARELTHEVSRLLEQRISKIEMVSASDVENWCDENSWDDPREIGKGLEAQLVVDIDLEQFSLYKGQTLYQGSADYSVQVIDIENGGDVVFKKTPPQLLWPPNSAVLTSEKREPEFRQQYLAVLAGEIGALFYPHDAYDAYARDADAL